MSDEVVGETTPVDAPELAGASFASHYRAATEIGGDPKDPAVLRSFGERVAEDYLARPPMRDLM